MSTIPRTVKRSGWLRELAEGKPKKSPKQPKKQKGKVSK